MKSVHSDFRNQFLESAKDLNPKGSTLEFFHLLNNATQNSSEIKIFRPMKINQLNEL